MPTSTSVSTYGNYIDGHWKPSASGRTFENRNPANTDDLIGLFQISNRQDVEEALDAASRAYETWRLVPAPIRAECSIAWPSSSPSGRNSLRGT